MCACAMEECYDDILGKDTTALVIAACVQCSRACAIWYSVCKFAWGFRPKIKAAITTLKVCIASTQFAWFLTDVGTRHSVRSV